MKIYLLIIFMCLGTLGTSGQEVVQIPLKRVERDKDFDISKVYDKNTGEKISPNIFDGLVRRNPNLYLDKIYDENGVVVKYIYDPSKQVTPKEYPQDLYRPKAKLLPENKVDDYRFKSIEGEILNSKELAGKLILIRFELFSSGFRFKKEEVLALDQKIKQFERKDDIVPIIIFFDSKEILKQNLQLPNNSFHIIPSGQGFIEKFGIRRFPSTIIIDQQGRFVERFSYSEDIEFSNYFE